MAILPPDAVTPPRTVTPAARSPEATNNPPVRPVDERERRQRNLPPQEPENEDYSLADITPENAGRLLMLELMQTIPPPQEGMISIADLKVALEKIRDGQPLTPIDEALLEHASTVVGSLRQSVIATGVAAYIAEGIDAQIEGFAREARRYGIPTGAVTA